MQHADDDLLTAARRGDRQASVVLYEKYKAQVYSFVYYRVDRNVAVAEEISAETFTRLVHNLPTLCANGKPLLTWLYTVARNLVVDHHRRSSAELLSASVAATDHSPEQNAHTQIEYERALDAMYWLSTDQRDVLIFRFLDGLSVAETAAVMGVKPGHVKTLTRRGLQRLRHRLEVDHG